MRNQLLAVLVASLVIASPLALAADGLKWSGSVSLGIRHTNDVATDSSKLNEYRDLGSTVPLTMFDIRGRSDDYYLNIFGENIGRDDMFLDFRGGKYGVFKYHLYGNELRHNFGSGAGARSPYNGIGGSVLTAVFPNPNVNTWNTFDHSYSRRDWGGMFEISVNSPWYFRTEINEVKRGGINVFAGAQGTSPGNGFIDLPTPIDYSTQNYSAEGGYSTNRGHFAVNVLYSKFSNDNDLLRWSNGFFGNGLDTTILPPDNELTRISANGNLRKLPGDSTLAGRATYSKLTNNVAVQPTMLSTGGLNQPTASSSSEYDGNIKHTTASLSLSSHPLQDLDTRVYWNWAREKNDSTRIVFSPAAASGLLGGASPNCSTTGPAPCVPERFGYKKNNYGVEGGYRLNRENRLMGGFDYYDIDRERIDFVRTLDRKGYAEWKNTSLDYLTSRLKYQYLVRRSDWQVPSAVIAFNPVENFVRRFDFANVDQHLVKVVLDATPAPLLDLGFEAIYKKNDYKDTPLGRTDDERQEYYASVSYGDPNKFRVMLFGDIEFMEFNSTHRVGSTNLANSDPNAPPSGGPPSTIYTWNAKNKDKSWQVGIGADWLVMERLTLKSSLIYAQTNGSVDFSAQPGATFAAPGILNIGNVDDTRRTSLNLKAIYRYTKQWEFTGGYAFERYRYSDIAYDDFGYIVPVLVAGVPTCNASCSYATGQYAFQPYTANIFYLIATYKFQ